MNDIVKYYSEYKRTQYEDISLCFNVHKVVSARYIEQKEVTYVGNELIEALPPMKKDIESYSDFEYKPYFNSSERNNDDKDRAVAITRLDDYRIAREYTACLDDAIGIALRRCYSARKKFNLEAMENLEETGRYFRDCYYKKIEGKKVKGFTLIGTSGGGKTTSIMSALHYYPQVIIHEDEHSRCTQIVYLKVECPADGSIKAFYDSCISCFEDALDIEIKAKKSAKTVDSKALLFKKLALRYNLGLLVIEEIQNLSIKHEDTMNQFLTLTNDTQIPLVFVGTYKACNRVFDIDFRLGRRGGEQIEVRRFDKDEYWEQLLAELWEYQWLKNYTPLTKELSDKFYEETGGIIDRVINLFQIIQLDAIQTGFEKITVKSIESMSKKYFATTRKMVLSITDELMMSAYEDLYSPSVIIEAKNQMITNIKLNNAKRYLLNQTANNEKRTMNEIRNEVITNIISVFGNTYNYKEIENVFNKLLSTMKLEFTKLTKKEMTKEVAKFLVNDELLKNIEIKPVNLKSDMIKGIDSFE